MIAVIVVFALIGLGVYFGIRSSKKRKADLLNANQMLGLVPLAAENGIPGSALGLHLYTLGRSSTTSNLYGGTIDGFETRVCDYAYTEREANGEYVTTEQTVAAYRRPGASLPLFHMLPSNLMQRAVSGLNKDVRIEDEVFRKMYLVRGTLPISIGGLFTPAVLEAFKHHDQKRRWHVECAEEWVIVYHAAKRVSGADLPQLLHEGATIARIFFDQTAGGVTAEMKENLLAAAAAPPPLPLPPPMPTSAYPPPVIQ